MRQSAGINSTPIDKAQGNTLTMSQVQHGHGQVRLDPTRTVEHQQKQPALAGRTAKLSALVVLLVGSLVVPGASAEQNEGSTAFMVPLCKTWLKTAADGDLNEIKRILKSDPSRLTTSGMCAGFLAGTIETLRAFELACPPDGVDNEQLVRIVVAQVEKHPELLRENFVVTASGVMMARWSCERPR